ncbi:exonuclease domain-containing protein [Leucobacter sp. HY1910]
MDNTPAAWAHDLIVFDTETTDKDPSTAHIVTAAVARLRDGHIIEEARTWLINPGVPIADEAAAVHGVSNEHAAAHGMDPATAAAEMIAALTVPGLPVVAFNAAFDFTVLRHVAETHGVPFTLPSHILDPFVLDKAVNKYRKGRRTLGAVCAVYGVTLEDAHDATADAVAAGQLMFALSPAVSGLSLERLSELQPELHEDQAASLEAFFRRTDPAAVVERGWPLRHRPSPAVVEEAPGSAVSSAGSENLTGAFYSAGEAHAAPPF